MREPKDYDGAIPDYSRAIALDPNYIDAYLDRASAREAKKNYAGAIIDLTKVIELQPTNVEAHYRRGNLRMTMGDSEGAIADCSKTSADGKIHRCEL